MTLLIKNLNDQILNIFIQKNITLKWDMEILSKE